MNKEIEAVQWIVENQNYYSYTKSGGQAFQELVKYGNNIHTYTAEALSAYYRIQENFLNNPYFYGTTKNWQSQKEKKDYTLFSCSICGYFITIPDGKKQLSVPFGVYRQWVTKDEYEIQVRKFLKQKKQELIQCEQKVEQKITKEISQLENKIVSLTTTVLSVEKNINFSATEQLWKKQRKRDVLIWFISLAVILQFWFSLLQIGQGGKNFIRACIPFGLVLLWRQWRLILTKRQKRRLQKERQMLQDYHAQYRQNCIVCTKKIDDMRIYELEAVDAITKVDMQDAENRLYQYLHQNKKNQEKPSWGKIQFRTFLFMAACAGGYILYVWYQCFFKYVPD